MRQQYSSKRAISVLLSTLAALVAIVAYPALVSAACTDPNQQSCSGSYGVSETFFGTGGQLCEPGTSGYSTNYCAKSSVGELGVGNSLGTAYQAQSGFNTDRQPSLAALVDDSQCTAVHPTSAGSSFDAGVLSTGSVSHVTGNFSVMSYLASGYVVITSGQAPTYAGGHTMTTLSYATPTAGTEGFGMNLKANTIAGGFGYNVSQLPDATFGFGQPAAPNGSVSLGYDSADKFSYRNGDQIAISTKSSGVTCYYPSYVFAISNVTPAGTYVFNQSIIVTSTF